MANLATINDNILADSGIDPINLIVGTGTVNYIPKFTAEGSIGNSIMTESGANILISSNIVLHAGNYNNYAPTLTGGGASGTWGINISGNASYATSAGNADTVDGLHASAFALVGGSNAIGTWPISITGTSGYANSAGSAGLVTGTSGGAIQSWDIRTIAPSNMTAGRLGFGFTSWTNNNGAPYADYLHLRSYTDASGGNDNLVMFLKSGIGMRIYQQAWGSSAPYTTYVDVLDSGNFNTWVPTKTGGGASGTWGISITGNADTLDGYHASAFALVSSLSNYLALSGGTMSGSINMGGNNITNIAQVQANYAIFTNDASSRVMYLRGSGNIIQFQDAAANNKWEVVGRDGQFYIYKNDGTGTGYIWQADSTGYQTFYTSASFNGSITNGYFYLNGFGYNTADADQWPFIYWLRDTAAGWDEGLIKASSSRGFFGRQGWGIHMHVTKNFTFFSSGWDALFGIEGGTGRVVAKGPIYANTSEIVATQAWVGAQGFVTGGPYVPTSRTLTINGVTYDLSANRSWTIAAGVTSIIAGAGIEVDQAQGDVRVSNTGVLSVNGSTGDITGIATTAQLAGYLPLAGGTMTGSLSFTDNPDNVRIQKGSNHLNLKDPWNNFHLAIYSGGIYTDATAYYFRNTSSSVWMSIENGDVIASSSMRAPIFYDSNDTNYYLNPNSNSRLNIVRAYKFENNDSVSSDSTFGLYFGNGDGNPYAIYRQPGAWVHPYPDLRIAFHTGIAIGANSSYGGIRFYTDYDMSTQVMSVNNSSDPLGGGNVYVTNSLQAGSSLRAPIFYDSNNTSYFLVPSSTSILNRIDVTNTYVGNAIYFGGGNNYLNWDGARINSNVGIQSTSEMRAPIFYDSQNTNYYLDPAGTSRLKAVEFDNGVIYYATAVGGPTANFGNGRIYLYAWPVASGARIISFKINLSTTWNWAPGFGYISADVSFYFDGTNLNSATTTITSATGQARNYLGIGQPVLANGFVAIPVYSVNTNSIIASIQGTPSFDWSVVSWGSWESIAFPGAAVVNVPGDFSISGTGTMGGSTLATQSWVNSQGFVTGGPYVPTSRTLTINGVTYDLSANRSWTIAAGGVNSIIAGTGISVDQPQGDVRISNTGVLSVNGSTGDITGIATTAQLAGYLPLAGGTMTGSIAMGGNNITNVSQLAHANGRIILSGNLHIDSFNGYSIYLQYYNQGTTTLVYGPLAMNGYDISNINIGYANNSFRAPIFYDSNDTNYYGNFAGVSRLSGLGVGESYYNHTYPGIIQSGSTSYNYDWYNGSWSSSVTVGYLANCSDVWEFAVHDSGHRVASVFYFQGGGVNRILMGRDLGWGSTYIEAASSFRAPIFYDSADTSYYLDPNSTSNLYAVVARSYQGNGNIDGTGSASYHPSGFYSTATSWLYGTLYMNGNNQRAIGGIVQNDLMGRPNAQWGAGGSTTGAVVIKFPGNTDNYGMVHAVIDIYEYNGNNVSTVIVGGHNWGSQWYSYGANVVGYTNKQVRVGVKDGKYCIIIGDASSSWSYGQVVLRKIQNGAYYSGVMDVGAGYTINIESDTYSWVSGDLRTFRSSGNIYMNEALVATQSWVSSQGYVTGGPFLPLSGGTVSGATTFSSTLNINGNTTWFSGQGSQLALENIGSLARFAFNKLDFYDWQNGIQMEIDGGYVYVNNYLQGGNSLRAPIFYDSNDTTYYLDPNSTSNLWDMRLLNGKWYTVNNNSGNSVDIYVRANADNTYVWRHIYGGSGTGYGTGAGGYGIYNQTLGGDYSAIFSSSGFVTFPYSVRSPIFYDSQDTAYYLDPNSGSVLNQVTTTGRIYSNEWIQFSNYTGLYSPNNNAHFRPNSGSYGSWLVTGSRNGWSGIEFESLSNGNVSLMISGNSNRSGFHNNSYGWQFEWEGGTLYTYKNTYGGGTRATVLDSSNYTSYSPSLTGSGASGTWGINITGNADTVDGYHESAFMRYYGYSTSGNFQTLQAVPGRLRFDQVGEIQNWSNAPSGIYTYGGVLSYRGDSFGLQIYASHVGGMVYKTQWNDDQYSGWLRILDTQNYNSYSPTLTGGNASGTWGINITGNSNYASTSNYANSSGTAQGLSIVGYGNGTQTFYQTPGTFAGYSGWASYLVSNHGDGATYYNQTIIMPFWGPPQYSRLEGGTLRGPWIFVTTENSPYAYNMNQYVRTTDSPTFTAAISINADGSTGYVASRIWLYSHNNYRGAGTYMSGTGSTWFAGTPYTDFDGVYMIGRRGYAGAPDAADPTYRLWQVSNGGNTYQIGNATATAFFEISDARLKTVVNEDYRVDAIVSIKPKFYQKNGKFETGYIAQEVEGVYQHAVSLGADGYLSLSYTQIHTLKIAALEDSVDDIKKKIKELEEKLNTLY